MSNLSSELKFTRLEIIDYTQETPRTVIHERDDGKVSTVSIQDDGHTLKVFVKAISLPTSLPRGYYICRECEKAISLPTKGKDK